MRASQFAWDPDQAQKVSGISQYPCAAHTDPCPTGRGFIGDYFGLAISNSNIYTLSVSTHYPGAGVTADGGGPVYYQQQVLATVPRSDFGAGFESNLRGAYRTVRPLCCRRACLRFGEVGRVARSAQGTVPGRARVRSALVRRPP